MLSSDCVSITVTIESVDDVSPSVSVTVSSGFVVVSSTRLRLNAREILELLVSVAEQLERAVLSVII